MAVAKFKVNLRSMIGIHQNRERFDVLLTVVLPLFLMVVSSYTKTPGLSRVGIWRSLVPISPIRRLLRSKGCLSRRWCSVSSASSKSSVHWAGSIPLRRWYRSWSVCSASSSRLAAAWPGRPNRAK
ncbi:hypothetical protein [Dictyobacter formicarum]|uniref:hypothetical protein n=1 Tax=Dictyobacter formicarum TaxID=2778368 RepID=UPI0019150024|nr:hypothetical protein [Dictyobacter formicarum]